MKLNLAPPVTRWGRSFSAPLPGSRRNQPPPRRCRRRRMDSTISETAQSAAARDQGLAGRLSQDLGEVYGGTNANAAALDTGRQYGGGSSGLSASGSQLAARGTGAAGQAAGGSGYAAGYS